MARPASFRLVFGCLARAAVVGLCLGVGGWLPGVVLADEAPKFRIKWSNKLDKVGDSHATLEVKMPASLYTLVKSNNPNTAVLLRRLGVGKSYACLEEAQGRFDDNTSTVVIEYLHRGVARQVSEGRWEAPVGDAAQAELIAQYDRTAIFNVAANTDFGMATMVMHVEIPAGASELKLRTSPARLAYTLAGSASGGDDASVDMKFEAQSQIMSCLAKTYGNGRFDTMWVARAVLKNSGNQTLKQYRVRFRVANYGSWSPWMQTARVAPGQTVVDPFFPVFDLDKIADLNGPRPVNLEMEYEYQTADGRKVQESDVRRVQLLGRNEVIFSNVAENEAVGWFDRYNNAPAILASFVSSNDPVMQQVAGGVARMSGGAAASLDAEGALKFMACLYQFMSQNQIAYQTPPGRTFEGQLGQHVKFGRDVLRAKAGTCIDLAILYASVCESVGLRSVVFVVPGHAFPAAYLPDGRLIPVEATLVGRKNFVAAVETATEEASTAINKGLFYKIEVRQLHDLGVYPMDLATVETDYLTKLGYNFEVQSQQARTTVVNTSQAGGQGNHNSQNQPNVQPNVVGRLQGRWGCMGTINGCGVAMALSFNVDGNYVAMLSMVSANGQTGHRQESGRFTIEGNAISFVPVNGTPVTRRFELRNNQLLVEFAEIGQIFTFAAAQ